MRISIIIPTLNEAQGIEQCLLALQPFRQQHCEIIVADGGSSDTTVAISQSLADILISAPKGRARQMNAGANQAHNDILLFLHADTLLPDTALNQLCTGINEGFDWGRFDIHLTGKHPMLKVIALMMNWRSRLTGIATGDQALFVRKQIFEKIGHYPDINLMEDIALSKQLKQLGKPFCIGAKVISSGRRWEYFGVYRTILLMWWLRAGFFFNISPDLLAHLYSRGLFWKR